MWLVYVVAGIAIIAALAAGIALGLHLMVPRWSLRRRALISAGLAAFLPMTVVFGGFLSEAGEAFADSGDDFLVSLLALFVIQVLLWAIVTLPPAWYFSARLEAGSRGEGRLPAADEPELIEG